MGRIIKYNIAKGDSIGERTKSTTFISSGGTTYNNTEDDDKKLNVNCRLWGNDFDGNDIDGTMTVYGDIYLRNPEGIDADDDEDDEEGGSTPTPDDDDDDDENVGVGRLEADDDVVSHKAVRGKEGVFEVDVTVGRHLYINDPHPAHNGEKKCVGELINGLDGRITTNATNISSLTTTVNNHTTQITNLGNRITTNEGNIQTNADDIANLKASNLTVDDVLQLIRDNQPSKLGAYDQPVVLWAGVLERSTISTTEWLYAGAHLPHFDIHYPTVVNGLMTIEIEAEEGYTVNVLCAHATQEHSGDTANLDTTYFKERSDGAHWFECRRDTAVNTKKVYIREFHQGDSNNDTWYSDNWESKDGGIQKINFSMIGYITPPST